jgi:hypothetical protein
VSPSSICALRISSSLTSSDLPPLSRTATNKRYPLIGQPIAYAPVGRGETLVAGTPSART